MSTRKKILIAVSIIVVASVVGASAALLIETTFGQFLAVAAASVGVFGLGALLLALAEQIAPMAEAGTGPAGHADAGSAANESAPATPPGPGKRAA